MSQHSVLSAGYWLNAHLYPWLWGVFTPWAGFALQENILKFEAQLKQSQLWEGGVLFALVILVS